MSDDVLTSHEIIKASSTDAQWRAFEDAVERLRARDLNELNRRIGTEVPENSDWRDYVTAWQDFEWFRFCDAYHHACGESYGA
jgi:hypothetical protein